MATKSSSLAYKHWLRIIRLWPTDPVRPKTVSFQHLMRQRLSKIQPSSPPSSSSSSLPPRPNLNAAATSIKSNEALVSAVSPSAPDPSTAAATSESAWDEARQMRQVNALYSLLENRYANENPMPQSLRRPSSDPEHYDVLVRELAEAPNRSWFGGLVKRIKGSLRFS